MNITLMITSEEMDQAMREVVQFLHEQGKYTESAMVREYMRRYANLSEYVDEIRTSMGVKE